MTAAAAAGDVLVRAARNGARIRLKPAEYVARFGPPARSCRDCQHDKPDEHDAGGKLDRAVLADIAAKADYNPATWGEGAWPSVPKIAQRIGYCDRSVQYALRRLEASGYLERIERPGRSSLFRIVRTVELLGSADTQAETPVQNVGDNRPPDTAGVAPGGATVAPDLEHLPTDQPPVAPLRGLGSADGAVAPAQAAAPDAPRTAPRAPSTSSPPSPAGVGAEPHRRMRPAERAAEPAPPVLEGVAVAFSDALPAVDEPAKRSRLGVLRTRRCPRCAAAPGEACRGARGQLRKSNHAERRSPDVYGPAAAAGLWRAPRAPGEAEF